MKANNAITVTEESQANVLFDPMLKPSVPSMNGVTQYLQTYADVNWVYACAFRKGVNLASLPLKVYTGENEDKKDVSDNPVFEVFKKPSPFHSRQNFWMATYGYLDTTGEVFYYMIRDSETQAPRGFIPLRPDRIEIIPDEYNYIKGYIYTVGGRQIPFQPWEIYFIKYFNPIDDYRGLSPIRAFTNDILLELNSVGWAKDFFRSGTKPSGILKTPDSMDDKQFKRLEKQFRQKYSGADSKAQGIIILEGEADFTAFSMAPKDAEFLNQRKFSKDAILSALGVPPLAIMDLSDSSELQNTEVQRRLFWNDTLKPMFEMMAELINTDIIHLYGVEGAYVEHDTSNIEALKEDREKKEKRYFEGFLKGAVTPNDIIVDVFGKEAVDDPYMNSYFLPTNLIPFAESEKKKSASSRLMLSGVDVKSIVDSTLKKETEKDRRQAIWKSMIVKADSVEVGFTHALKRLFKEQEKVVLENYDNIKSFTKEYQGELFNESSWISKFNETALPFIIDAIEEGGNHALNNLGIVDEVFDITNEATQQLIKDRLDLFGTSVNGTTRDAIAEAIANGMNNNESIDEIRMRLEDIFDIAERSRAKGIARTEVMNSFNHGNLEGMIQSKIVDEHEWLTMQDAVVRDSHALDGVRVKLGEPFPVGAEYTGWTAAWPSDHYERCTTIPVSKILQ